jgi:hypothetical protein
MALVLHQQPLQLGQGVFKASWHLIVDGALQHLQIIPLPQQLLALLEAANPGCRGGTLQGSKIFQQITHLLELAAQLMQLLGFSSILFNRILADLPTRMQKKT